jgi:hypothetical protein
MGQARIPSAAEMFALLRMASEAGWFVTAERGRDDEHTVGQGEVDDAENGAA